MLNRRLSVRRIAAIVLGTLTYVATDSSSHGLTGEIPDKLPLSREPVSERRVQRAATSVEWQGEAYDVTAGIDVVMDVVRDRSASSRDRQRALLTLAMLRRELEGRPCLDELVDMFDKASTAEKQSIVVCLQASDDPRGIPVFVRTLENEKDLKLRLWAASALAHWNVRRGVAELVKMLDSTEMLPAPTGILPYVRDNAMRTFRLKNIRKGWGFPDDKEAAEWPPDVTPPPEVASRLTPRPTVEEIKKWWAENKHRFPEWNPGDALPELPEDKKNKSSEK